MFKKIKESEAVAKYKELKSNPQTSAAMSLGLYLVFFFIIVVLVRGMTTPNISTNEPVVNKKLTNYEYTYQNNIVTIFGQYYSGKQVFNILNSKYYYDKENVYVIKGNTLELVSNFDMSVLKITPEMVDELTINLTFTDGGNYKQYLVPLVNFINLYEIDTEVDLSVASGYNIIVKKYFEENNLYKIEIDMSSYYKINNLEDEGILTIDLHNQNKLNDFSLEYDKMLGVK